MANLSKHLSGTEVKIFDPRDESTGLEAEPSYSIRASKREDDQWWLYLAGQAHGYGATEIFSASLPPQTPLSATGWDILATRRGSCSHWPRESLAVDGMERADGTAHRT